MSKARPIIQGMAQFDDRSAAEKLYAEVNKPQ